MLRFLRSKADDASDAELLRRFKAEEEAGALAVLFDRYLELIYGLCMNYFKDATKAEDAVMNIYMELQQKVPQHEIQNFKSWLFTFTRNHCLMVFRKEKKEISQSFDPTLMYSVENLHPINEETEENTRPTHLEACIEELNIEQKDCIQLFYYKEMSYKEIADQTNKPLGTVRSYIQNGRRNLKNCIEQKEQATN